MNKFARDFISEENREYKMKLGRSVASSLAGFICGVVTASIIWMVAIFYLQAVLNF